MRAALALACILALPGCVVVPVWPLPPPATPEGAGAAAGALIGAALGAALIPPPGPYWDSYAQVWRLP